MNVKSPSPPFIFFVKNVTLPQEAVKFIVTHPLLLTNMVCGWVVQQSCGRSFTQTHLLARVMQPPIALFSAITVYPGPFRQLIFRVRN